MRIVRMKHHSVIGLVTVDRTPLSEEMYCWERLESATPLFYWLGNVESEKPLSYWLGNVEGETPLSYCWEMLRLKQSYLIGWEKVRHRSLSVVKRLRVKTALHSNSVEKD